MPEFPRPLFGEPHPVDVPHIVREMASGWGIELTHAEAEYGALISAEPGHTEEALARSFEAGELSKNLLTYLVPSAWRHRADHSKVSYELWREMFLAARFTVDFAIAPRPSRSVVAFRGATPGRRDGIGWTLDLEQARYFARNRQGSGATVWVCTIPGDRVLARYVKVSFENEVTADVRGLEIKELKELSPMLRFLVATRRIQSRR